MVTRRTDLESMSFNEIFEHIEELEETVDSQTNRISELVDDNRSKDDEIRDMTNTISELESRLENWSV